MTTVPATSSKSCRKCPSYLTTIEVPGKFGKSTGSPMCGRFGTVLGKPSSPNSQQEKLQKHIADNCTEYGAPMPPSPSRNMEVMLPDPTLRNILDPTDPLVTSVTSCAMCSKFVPEVTVEDELGWTTGLCAAKGKLLLTNKLASEARNCEYRQIGASRGTTSGMHFLPEYEDSFRASSSPLTSASEYRKEAESGFIEPGDWPTDKEVTEGDKTAGIKSWRKIQDPEGERFVYFPVYDSSFFDPSDQAMIPKTGSDEHPELYVDHFGGMYGLGVAWLELDETPTMWGQAGVGKTELFRHAAWIMQLPFVRISVTSETGIDDIAGRTEFTPERGTYFEYGRLPLAWQKPCVLVLDEPNVAKDPAVWHFIRPLTDNSKQMVLDMNRGEALDRSADTYMGLAMNPAWDYRNVGAMEVADADANRLFHTYMEMPPPDLEREIIRARVALDGWDIPDATLTMVMKTAADIRALSEDESLPITWAIRPQIKVARALRWFEPTTAYKRAAGDYLDRKVLELLLDQVRANFINEVF